MNPHRIPRIALGAGHDRPSPGRRRAVLAALTTAVVGASGVLVAGHAGHDAAYSPTATTTAANPATPGNFKGYAFDQCQAPSQSAMNTWLDQSPYLGVGIYIAGNSRACRNQTYLNATWVRTQLAKGWKLLPITLGPQASCQPRFPRYKDDFKISPAPGADGKYATARKEGMVQAGKSVTAAKALGIVPGSTMYYDLEGFDASNTRCRESALRFLSGWTLGIHNAGYLSGVYSSAGSGLKALDAARVQRPYTFNFPDQVWIADWDGKANTSSSYISATGWTPHARVKQFQGGHNERYGGVTINIDRDFVDVGQGMVAPRAPSHCGGVRIGLTSYPVLDPHSSTPLYAPAVESLKCLLTEQGYFHRPINSAFGQALMTAVERWKTDHHWQADDVVRRRDWVALLTTGPRLRLKYGSAYEAVRYLQRALNAAVPGARLPITGCFAELTQAELRTYQRNVGLPVTGIATAQVWDALAAGKA